MKQVAMDRDMNKYDLEHVTTAHPTMSAHQLADVYHAAWERYYSDAHIETILRRAAATGFNVRKMADMLTLFAGAVRIEGVHPLQVGFVRRKIRTQRRSGLPVEAGWRFYPRRVAESVKSLSRWGELALRYRRILRKVRNDPLAKSYTDDALRPSPPDHVELPDFVHAFADKLSTAQRKQMKAAAG
jgi:hypothetical protein